jgi:hypothetical protein
MRIHDYSQYLELYNIYEQAFKSYLPKIGMARDAAGRKTKRMMLGGPLPGKKKEVFGLLKDAYIGKIGPFGTRIRVHESRTWLGQSGKNHLIEVGGAQNGGYIAIIRRGSMQGVAFITKEKIRGKLKTVVLTSQAMPAEYRDALKKIAKTNIEVVSKKELGPRLSRVERDFIIKSSIQLGLSLREIASKLGTSEKALRGYSYKHGIELK